MYPQLLPDTGEQQKTLTESIIAANEHITRFARLLRSFNGSSRTKEWSERLDSNQRPHGPQPCALPDCATLRMSHFKCYAWDSQAPSPLLLFLQDWQEIVLVSFFPPMRVHCNGSSARHSHDHIFFVRGRKYCVQVRFRSLRSHIGVYAPHRFSEEDRYSCILQKPSLPIEVVRFEVC